MNLAKHLDWISATQVGETLEAHQEIVPEGMELDEAIRPPARFHQAWKLKPAGSVALSATDTMCRMVQFTGSELETVRMSVGITDAHMLQHLCAVCNHITRLDYAVDVMDSQARVGDILEAWRAGGLKTRYQTVQHFKTLTGSRGETVYFGSVKSAQRIRIYDKAAELKLLKKAWLRVELQTRKKKATALSHDMNEQGIVSSGDTRIRDLLGWQDVGWYSQAINGDDASLTPVPRSPKAWQKWMDTQVLTSLIQHANNPDDNMFLQEWLNRAKRATIAAWNSQCDNQ